MEKNNPKELVYVPFSKTECGVDFYINAGHSSELWNVLTEYSMFKTNFFELFFFKRVHGYVLLDFNRIELHDDMLLVVSPHQQQEWHVNEEELEFHFLIFREDFLQTFIADKVFQYRLLYCYQSDTPPLLMLSNEQMQEYIDILQDIKRELQNPLADSYNIIVSRLYYLLVIVNRRYGEVYSLPEKPAKNYYGFLYKEMLETYITEKQRVSDYADMLHVSRTTLNNAVKAQFGVSAQHLLKQRLLTEIKNRFLFGNRTVSQLADDFNFSDPSHLMRFFKSQTGKTFLQYREDYQRGKYE
jgi:AraC-like DNA-binding protein